MLQLLKSTVYHVAVPDVSLSEGWQASPRVQVSKRRGMSALLLSL